MPDNGRKEFPETALEHDATSKWGRRIYCYLANRKYLIKYAKRSLNRRFRRKGKAICREYSNDDRA